MKILIQLKEWQTPSGKWTCAFVDKFSPNVDNFILPARAMNMSLENYISFVQEKYKPDEVYWYKTGVGFRWFNQASMRKYKNDINAIFRKQNFIIDF